MQIDEDHEDGPQLSKLASQYADLSAQVAELKQFIAPSPQQPCKPMRQQQQQQQQKPQKPKQPPPRQQQTELPHTASPQPAPRSSYASVAAAGSAATAAASATKPRVPRAPRSSPPCQERKAFIVQTPKGVLPSAGPLCQAVSVLLRDHIPELAQNYVYITDAVRVGDQSASSRVYITVKRLEYAETLVRFRCRLKNSGITVFDVLSPVERKLHQQLWPLFLEARARGQKAQFQRARLMVDGVRVQPPPGGRRGSKSSG